jgi:drug/metabolite transporter (DMT)-like permease
MVPVTGFEFSALLGLGVLGTLAHLSMTWALRYASAPTVAPVQYLEIPFGALYGLVLFSELPNGIAAVGIIVTVTAGLLVVRFTKTSV